METIKAKFTEISQNTNWYKGIVGKYTFEAKIFEDKSSRCISDGNILQLSIFNTKFNIIIEYDKEWVIRPNKKTKPYFEAVVNLVELHFNKK